MLSILLGYSVYLVHFCPQLNKMLLEDSLFEDSYILSEVNSVNIYLRLQLQYLKEKLSMNYIFAYYLSTKAILLV